MNMKKSIHMTWISTLLLAVLVASCAPAVQSAPAAATNVSLPTAVPAATAVSPVTSGNSSTSEIVSPTAAAPNSNSAPAAGAIVYTVASSSFAQYRVREQLAGVSFPTDAVGKTTQISGSVTVNPDGTIDPAHSKIVVDLSTLQSDRSMRDNFVGRNVLNTSQYPDAVFVPKQITGLTFPLPQSGNASFQLAGDLTVRDVTKPVTWDVTGTLSPNQATGTATTSFTFEDFDLNQPRIGMVLSITDKITLEVTITLQRSGA
jgi:polyisoprenoid-binding protein YceI